MAKNPLELADTLLSSDIVYKFPNYIENPKAGMTRLYHQTTLPKLKQILKDKQIKGDVWSQEDIKPDQWRYGDYAIAFDIEPSKIHRANESDRIIYGDIPIESLSFIKARTPRTPIGIKHFEEELK